MSATPLEHPQITTMLSFPPSASRSVSWMPQLTSGSLASANSSTSTYTSSPSNTFVGNTPSTVLFFLAMSVGVIIACLFIFFTVRYFVRSRYGLNVYPVTHHGMMFSTSLRDAGPLNYTPSSREIQEHLDYLRTHHFLRGEFLERRFLTGAARRRRRRGRYARMKKLTADEVEDLFPKKLYAEWLASGDEDDSDTLLLMQVDVVHDQSLATSARMVVPVKLSKESSGETPADLAVVEIHEMHDLHPRHLHDAHTDTVSLGVLLGHKVVPHFDSGSCAICLEVFENDDVVRGLVCGHVFHAECVDPWLIRRRACCPICKRDYYKEESLDGTNNLREGEHNEVHNGHEEEHSGHDDAQNGHDDEHNEQNGDLNDQQSNGLNDGLNSNLNGDLAGPRTNEGTGTGGTATVAQRTDIGTAHQPRDDDDDVSINYDALRTDPNLQALLHELIPISERVRVILDEHPDLDLEARGREIANLKYNSICKKVFWKFMGILKDDLFNWAVIQVYQADQRNNSTSLPDSEHQSDGGPGQQQPSTRVSSESRRNTEESTENAPAVLSRSPSIYENASNMEGVDVSEATRRDTAERQV